MQRSNINTKIDKKRDKIRKSKTLQLLSSSSFVAYIMQHSLSDALEPDIDLSFITIPVLLSYMRVSADTLNSQLQ